MDRNLAWQEPLIFEVNLRVVKFLKFLKKLMFLKQIEYQRRSYNELFYIELMARSVSLLSVINISHFKRSIQPVK